MKTIALIYSHNSGKSAKVAVKIQELLSKHYKVEEINIETCNFDVFQLYDQYILSVPTWFDGELPNYWDEILPSLRKLEFSGKNFAFFGLGDQKNYPENFCDALGILALFFESRGGKIIGKTSTEGYFFESSKALKNNLFYGLLLDQENQARLTEERLNNWVELLEKEIA
ncbi:MAG: flavodoxin [Marinilabiliales bacterium]|nr:flavodoxin [Marinilabiliales bacterium]